MSKDITVQERGVPKDFDGVGRLNTQVGGGASDWLPVDETVTMRRDITANGDYVAAAENPPVYGYHSVDVNVPIVEREYPGGWDHPTPDFPWTDVENGCVAGYEKDTNVYYVACTLDNNLTVRAFPSYLTVEEMPLSEASGRRSDVMSFPGIKVVLRTGDGNVYREIRCGTDEWEQYISIGTEGRYGSLTWKDVTEQERADNPDVNMAWRTEYVPEDAAYSVATLGTLEAHAIRPSCVRCYPFWLGDFAQWGLDEASEAFWCTGRDIDPDVLGVTYKVIDGELISTAD